MPYQSDRELVHLVMKQIRQLTERLASFEQTFMEALLAQGEEVARREAQEEAKLKSTEDILNETLRANGVDPSALRDLPPGVYSIGPDGLVPLSQDAEPAPEPAPEGGTGWLPCNCPVCTLRRYFERVSQGDTRDDAERRALFPLRPENLSDEDIASFGLDAAPASLEKYRRKIEGKPKAKQAETMQEAWARLTDEQQRNEVLGKPRLSEVFADLERELNFATSKFPGKNVTFAALVEEVGELATALFSESRAKVRKEALQVATMALRVILDGDHTFDSWRELHGLDRLKR